MGSDVVEVFRNRLDMNGEEVSPLANRSMMRLHRLYYVLALFNVITPRGQPVSRPRDDRRSSSRSAEMAGASGVRTSARAGAGPGHAGHGQGRSAIRPFSRVRCVICAATQSACRHASSISRNARQMNDAGTSWSSVCNRRATQRPGMQRRPNVTRRRRRDTRRWRSAGDRSRRARADDDLQVRAAALKRPLRRVGARVREEFAL